PLRGATRRRPDDAAEAVGAHRDETARSGGDRVHRAVLLPAVQGAASVVVVLGPLPQIGGRPHGGGYPARAHVTAHDRIAVPVGRDGGDAGTRTRERGRAIDGPPGHAV